MPANQSAEDVWVAGKPRRVLNTSTMPQPLSAYPKIGRQRDAHVVASMHKRLDAVHGVAIHYAHGRGLFFLREAVLMQDLHLLQHCALPALASAEQEYFDYGRRRFLVILEQRINLRRLRDAQTHPISTWPG
jgi:hypothetical protein